MRFKCNDCGADAEMSGFGLRLCEACYQRKLKESIKNNDLKQSENID